MSQETLNASIKAAEAELKKAAGAPTSEQEPEVEVEAEPEPESEEETSGDEPAEADPATEELSEEELAEARRVYKALKNPETSGPLIAALAQQSGILAKLGEAPKKTEVAAAKKEITDILGDALGEYKFLAPKLGPAIEKILEQERESQQTELAAIQQTQIERDVVAVTEKLAAETKGASRNLEARMSALANEVPIGTMDVNTYVRRLYAIANSEKRGNPQAIADRIRKNANDAASRLPSGTSGRPSKAIEMPAKKMSLDESINWAAGQLGMGGRKR